MGPCATGQATYPCSWPCSQSPRSHCHRFLIMNWTENMSRKDKRFILWSAGFSESFMVWKSRQDGLCLSHLRSKLKQVSIDTTSWPGGLSFLRLKERGDVYKATDATEGRGNKWLWLRKNSANLLHPAGRAGSEWGRQNLITALYHRNARESSCMKKIIFLKEDKTWN